MSTIPSHPVGSASSDKLPSFLPLTLLWLFRIVMSSPPRRIADMWRVRSRNNNNTIIIIIIGQDLGIADLIYTYPLTLCLGRFYCDSLQVAAPPHGATSCFASQARASGTPMIRGRQVASAVSIVDSMGFIAWMRRRAAGPQRSPCSSQSGAAHTSPPLGGTTELLASTAFAGHWHAGFVLLIPLFGHFLSPSACYDAKGRYRMRQTDAGRRRRRVTVRDCDVTVAGRAESA